MPTPEWRFEKAGNIIRSTCFMIRHTKSIASEGHVDGLDLRGHFHQILWDATKLYCDAVRELYGENRYAIATWSPDLPKFLFEHPEECDDSLKIVASEDYRDNYYDKEPPT